MEEQVKSLLSLQKSINGLARGSISVTEVCEMPMEFFVRFDVTSRVYKYCIACEVWLPAPFAVTSLGTCLKA